MSKHCRDLQRYEAHRCDARRWWLSQLYTLYYCYRFMLRNPADYGEWGSPRIIIFVYRR
jgi:hypothetical protein